jgi:hypothetical protein
MEKQIQKSYQMVELAWPSIFVSPCSLTFLGWQPNEFGL